MAAENWIALRWPSVERLRFNEAAAHGRGKRRAAGNAGDVRPGFNEAAAHGRGKRGEGCGGGPSHRGASMRPRRMAAENFGDVPLPFRTCSSLQ